MSVNVAALSIHGQKEIEIFKVKNTEKFSSYPVGFFLVLTGMCANQLLDGKSQFHLGVLWISEINWYWSFWWVAEGFFVVTVFHFQTGEHKQDGD